MKHVDRWSPTKYVHIRGRLRSSRNELNVNVASRLIADLVAGLYEDAIPTHVRGHIVDLGCGRVPFYAEYRPYATEVTCIDWPSSPHMTIHVDHECDLSRPLPLSADAFDTIILSDVLEHVPNPEFLWREMARIIRVGGKLLLNVPFYYMLHETPNDYYRFTRFALERFARDNNFRVVTIRPTGGSVDIFADLAAKHLLRVPLVGSLAARAVQAAALSFGDTRLGRRVREVSGERYPLGYFLVAERLPDASSERT